MKKLTATKIGRAGILRRCFLTGLFPLMTLTSVSGQVSFGIKAGPSFSKMDYNAEDFNAKTLTSFHGGVMVGFKLGSQFSLQPELLYSAKGTRFESMDGVNKMEAQYICLPVMVGYKINNLTLKAGPELNLRIGADSELIPFLSEEDLFNSTEVGLGAGIAYNFLEKFGAEFRYIAGLTDAGNLNFTDINGNTIEGEKKIQAMQLSVFYLFKS